MSCHESKDVQVMWSPGHPTVDRTSTHVLLNRVQTTSRARYPSCQRCHHRTGKRPAVLPLRRTNQIARRWATGGVRGERTYCSAKKVAGITRL